MKTNKKKQGQNLIKNLGLIVLVMTSASVGHAKKAKKPKPVPRAVAHLGQAVFAGTGCALGQGARAEFVPEISKIVVQFDSLEAQSSGDRRIDRKSCNMVLPIRVPAGYSLILSEPSIILSSDLQEAKALFHTEYFTAGARGEIVEHEEVSLQQGLIVSGQQELHTACGQSLNLRTNSSVLVQSQQDAETQNFARIEALTLGLRLEKCN